MRFVAKGKGACRIYGICSDWGHCQQIQSYEWISSLVSHWDRTSDSRSDPRAGCDVVILEISATPYGQDTPSHHHAAALCDAQGGKTRFGDTFLSAQHTSR